MRKDNEHRNTLIAIASGFVLGLMVGFSIGITAAAWLQ